MALRRITRKTLHSEPIFSKTTSYPYLFFWSRFTAQHDFTHSCEEMNSTTQINRLWTFSVQQTAAKSACVLYKPRVEHNSPKLPKQAHSCPSQQRMLNLHYVWFIWFWDCTAKKCPSFEVTQLCLELETDRPNFTIFPLENCLKTDLWWKQVKFSHIFDLSQVESDFKTQ